jgi:hypothetical protein
MPSPVAETLGALASALDGLGVSWYLFGAQAALVRGSHRLTEDIDVTVLLGDVSPETLQASVRAAGFALRVEDVDDFVATTRVLPFVHETTRMPVDLVIGGPGLEELFLQDSERLLVGDVRQGYASEAIQILLRQHFDEYRYQKVNTRVHGFNAASIALHEKLGFQHEGRIRRAVYTGGRYWDLLLFGLTVEEFRARAALVDGDTLGS